MRSRTAGLALLTAVTAASPAQGALEGPVQVLAGAGGRPDVLLRADGTALVSWESGTSVQVCRLPPGATACAGTATIAGPPGTTSRSRPFLLEGSSSRVLVVQGACCPQATQRFASTDGGALFGAGTDFASVVPADEGVIAGPGTQISLLGAPARYQLASSTGFGKTTQVVTLDTDAAIVGSRALALDPATGRPFATWGTAADAEAAGATSTTPSTAASWGAPGALAGTTGVRLAAGWATWVRGGRHEIARWTGAAFAEPVALANAAADTGEADIAVDPSGNVHVVWSPVGSGRVCYAQASDGGALGPPVLLGGDTDGVSGLQVAASGPATGRVVFSRPGGAGPVSSLALASATLRPNVCGLAPFSLALGVNAGGTRARIAFDPAGQETGYHVEIGTTTDYGTVTPDVAVDGAGRVAAVVTLQGLAPGTTYHARLVATNATGTTAGEDVTFTTPARTPGAREVIGFPAGCRSGRLRVAVGTAAFPARRALVRVAGWGRRRLGPDALAGGSVTLRRLPRRGVRVRVTLRLATGRIVTLARRFPAC